MIVSFPNSDHTTDSTYYISKDVGISYLPFKVGPNNSYIYQCRISEDGHFIALSFGVCSDVYFSKNSGESFNIIYSSSISTLYILLGMSSNGEFLYICDKNMIYIYNYSTNTLINSNNNLPVDVSLKTSYQGISVSSRAQYLYIPIYNFDSLIYKIIKIATYGSDTYEILSWKLEVIENQLIFNPMLKNDGTDLIGVSTNNTHVYSSYDGNNHTKEGFFL